MVFWKEWNTADGDEDKANIILVSKEYEKVAEE